jgi:hypothetical protein
MEILQQEITHKQKQDNVLFLDPFEKEVWIQEQVLHFTKRQEDLGLEETSDSIEKKIRSFSYKDLGTTSTQVDAHQATLKVPDWYRITRSPEEEKAYFLKKSHERMLEDAEETFRLSLEKFEHLRERANGETRKVEIYCYLCLNEMLVKATANAKEYRYGEEVVEAVKEELTARFFKAVYYTL